MTDKIQECIDEIEGLVKNAEVQMQKTPDHEHEIYFELRDKSSAFREVIEILKAKQDRTG